MKNKLRVLAVKIDFEKNDVANVRTVRLTDRACRDVIRKSELFVKYKGVIASDATQLNQLSCVGRYHALSK